MNPEIFEIEHKGETLTCKTHEGAVGVVRRLFKLGKVSWVEPAPGVTLVSSDKGVFKVTRKDLPLAWIKWA